MSDGKDMQDLHDALTEEQLRQLDAVLMEVAQLRSENARLTAEAQRIDAGIAAANAARGLLHQVQTRQARERIEELVADLTGYNLGRAAEACFNYRVRWGRTEWLEQATAKVDHALGNVCDWDSCSTCRAGEEVAA